jgi:hypothetical protein
LVSCTFPSSFLPREWKAAVTVSAFFHTSHIRFPVSVMA